MVSFKLSRDESSLIPWFMTLPAKLLGLRLRVYILGFRGFIRTLLNRRFLSGGQLRT